MKITQCRYCGSQLREIISLGNLPLVNYFPLPAEVAKEKKYPLHLVVCTVCGLIQLDFIVPPKDIFHEYHYTTGASAPLVQQLGKLAQETLEKFTLTKTNRVLDIGSNDGTLLSFFAKKEIEVLGVEPSHGLAQEANAKGVPTKESFFNKKTAGEIRKTHGQFDLIFATHVLANVVDLTDFFEGVCLLLSHNGSFIVEVGYVGAMLAHGQFDAIYHEHYSYFSLASLTRICADNGFVITEVSFPDAQGGALRVTAKHTGAGRPIDIPENIQISDYDDFAKGVKKFRTQFCALLDEFKGKTIIGFGAPAKSVTLLSYCGIGQETIMSIVDSTPAKRGRLLPGAHIQIIEEAALVRLCPAAIVILAWNYQEEIQKKLSRLLKKKTPVIIPFPKLRQVTLAPGR